MLSSGTVSKRRQLWAEGAARFYLALEGKLSKVDERKSKMGEPCLALVADCT